MLSEGARRAIYYVLLPLLLAGVATFLANTALNEVPVLNALSIKHSLGASIENEKGLKPDPRILVVLINPETPQNLGFPESVDRVPREIHAKLIEKLDQTEASVVFFDLIFRRPQPNADKELRRALSEVKSIKVVLATVEKNQNPLPPERNPDVAHYEFELLSIWDEVWTKNVHIASTHNVESNDEIVYGASLLQKDFATKKPIFHAAWSIITLVSGGDPRNNCRIENDFLFTDFLQCKLTLPENNGISLIPNNPSTNFETISYERLVHILDSGQDSLNGRFILIGADDGKDVKQISGSQNVPGVMVHAMILNTLLQSQLSTKVVDSRISLLIAWMLTATMLITTWSKRAPYWIITVTASLLLSGLIIPIVLNWVHLQIDLLLLLTSVLLAAILGATMLAVTRSLVDIRPAGSSYQSLVIFLDVKDSTELLQRLGADGYRKLNTELNLRLSRVLEEFGTSIERTTGDGFMAVMRLHQNNMRSSTMCRLLRDLVAASREVFKAQAISFAGEAPVTVGAEVGVVTGDYVIEDGARHWSSSGLVVNLSQRLQSKAKDIGVDVVVGPGFYALAGEEGTVKAIGPAELKGIKEPIQLFTLA